MRIRNVEKQKKNQKQTGPVYQIEWKMYEKIIEIVITIITSNEDGSLKQ